MNRVVCNLASARPSKHLVETYDYEYLQHVSRKIERSEFETFMWMAASPRLAGESGTMSNYLETHLGDHSNGKTAYTMPTTVALALTTVVPTSAMTGATITEANYTGYGRQTIAAATFNAYTAGGAGAASTTATNAAITFANCTAGSSTIIGWGTLDSATTAAGNLLWWGTATSTVISTTQTPATIASGGLTESLL